MFSFRRDKTGFFVTIILLTIFVGTVVAPGVLLIVGLAQGDWLAYATAIKIILSAAWVGSIVTVIVRVAVFRWQWIRKQRAQAAASVKEPQETREPS
jgi:predicted membrane protein